MTRSPRPKRIRHSDSEKQAMNKKKKSKHEGENSRKGKDGGWARQRIVAAEKKKFFKCSGYV